MTTILKRRLLSWTIYLAFYLIGSHSSINNFLSWNDAVIAFFGCVGAFLLGNALGESLFLEKSEKESFSGPIDTSSYTFDELRALGCPDGLLMQYVCLTKEEVNRAIKMGKDQT